MAGFGTSLGTAFGGAKTTAAPAFGNNSASPFTSNTPAFGATPTTPAFGATPAATTGGGIFGAGAKPATATPATPAFGATPAATTGGGIFGAGAKPATATPAATTGGGIFGAAGTTAPTPTPKTPATGTTSFLNTATANTIATPAFGTATAATPATPALGQKTATDASSGTTAFGTSGTSNAQLSSVQKPSGPAITYTEMEKQLNRWKSEIKKKREEFVEQSRKVQQCDETLVRNNAKIEELQAEVNKVKILQHSLHGQLSGIRSHQELIRDVITREAEKAQQFRHPQPDSERELTYQRAENINFRLDQACTDLKSIITSLNAQVDGNQIPEDDPMIKISQILGAHVDTLSWVEKRTDTLRTRVSALENSRRNYFPSQSQRQGYGY